MTCNIKVMPGGACGSGHGVELRLGPGVPGLDPGFNFEGMDRWTIVLAWPPNAELAE
jgi:hypothetical protein